MSRKEVLVLAGNVGGLTAAPAVKHELYGDGDVTVVAASPDPVARHEARPREVLHLEDPPRRRLASLT
jgi:hypothetical protein